MVAATANSRELAERIAAEWELERLPLAYGVTREDADRWGLFVSGAIKDTEPEWFVEPAVFVVDPECKLYASIVQTMPFSRPPAKQLLSTLDWIIENGYAARGELD